MSDVFKASDAMVVNQQRGKALKKRKSKTVRSFDNAFETVSMSSKSFSNDLTLDDIKDIYLMLYKSKQSLTEHNIDDDGNPSDNYLTYLEYGGDAGLAWSYKVLKEQEIIKTLKDISNKDIETPNKDKWSDVSISKSVNEELKQATFLVLSPEEVDLHGDIYSEDEIRKACHNFNSHSMTANLFHLVETTSFSIVESYISQVDMVLGETFIQKGSWMAVLQFNDDEIWEEVKAGNFTGVSVGCKASVEYLDEE